MLHSVVFLGPSLKDIMTLLLLYNCTMTTILHTISSSHLMKSLLNSISLIMQLSFYLTGNPGMYVHIFLRIGHIIKKKNKITDLWLYSVCIGVADIFILFHVPFTTMRGLNFIEGVRDAL